MRGRGSGRGSYTTTSSMSKVVVTPREFVEEFYLLKQSYVASMAQPASQASALLQKMKLSGEQQAFLAELLDTALTDVLYTVLLGLDGAAQIGVKQVSYTVLDEYGNRICSDGEVEALAYEMFQ
jgi:hypothetical protein